MSDIHIHIPAPTGSGDTHVHLHITANGPVLAAIQQLKELAIMNQAELATALGDVATALGDVASQLDKGINEVVLALQNSGNTSPEVDAKVQALSGIATALKAATQTLDDINQDTPPA